MRADIFDEKKCVHVKLTKEVHFALRSKLFKHNVSMQELFDECARLIVEDTGKGDSIIKRIVNRKLKESLSGVKRKRNITLGELDSEMLYSMISEPSKESE